VDLSRGYTRKIQNMYAYSVFYFAQCFFEREHFGKCLDAHTCKIKQNILACVTTKTVNSARHDSQMFVLNELREVIKI